MWNSEALGPAPGRPQRPESRRTPQSRVSSRTAWRWNLRGGFRSETQPLLVPNAVYPEEVTPFPRQRQAESVWARPALRLRSSPLQRGRYNPRTSTGSFTAPGGAAVPRRIQKDPGASRAALSPCTSPFWAPHCALEPLGGPLSVVTSPRQPCGRVCPGDCRPCDLLLRIRFLGLGCFGKGSRDPGQARH